MAIEHSCHFSRRRLLVAGEEKDTTQHNTTHWSSKTLQKVTQKSVSKKLKKFVKN
jgi:hypothetical protein